MNSFYTIAGIALLVLLAVQDFKEKKISWLPLLLLFVVFAFKGITSLNYRELVFYFSVNVSFIVLQFVLLTVYFSLKKRKLTNIINQYIGIGDLLFFIAICATFSPVNFILFYCGCLVLTLISIFVYHFLVRKEIKEIPLAGIFSIVLIATLILNNFSSVINFYDDKFIMSIFI